MPEFEIGAIAAAAELAGAETDRQERDEWPDFLLPETYLIGGHVGRSRRDLRVVGNRDLDQVIEIRAGIDQLDERNWFARPTEPNRRIQIQQPSQFRRSY